MKGDDYFCLCTKLFDLEKLNLAYPILTLIFIFLFQDKIVPSLLYNMDGESSSRGATHLRDTPELSGPEKETPSQLGETILRELVSSASGSTVKAVLAPVLRHFDNHNLWEEKSQLVKNKKS
jgi:hypothetical protein